MLRKTGILGGTFDPIHTGHLIIAEQAYSQLGLDKVLIMPTGNPDYKGRSDITDKHVRAEMVRASISGNEHFEFSDIELFRHGYIYTADTLTMLKEKNPDDDFYLIIGGDSFDAIEKWKMPEIIFKLANIAVYMRSDVDANVNAGYINTLVQKYDARITILRSHLIDISSSSIRGMVHAGQSVKYLVSDRVEEFIRQYGLYK